MFAVVGPLAGSPLVAAGFPGVAAAVEGCWQEAGRLLAGWRQMLMLLLLPMLMLMLP